MRSRVCTLACESSRRLFLCGAIPPSRTGGRICPRIELRHAPPDDTYTEYSCPRLSTVGPCL
ncbi:hypothetical protein CENSYa_1596 [Cenarchaeum symbiosum A]|uniref:Uncharacterized protein n=1 Tax=Cenarchaeum symbiosum (strain A) TaxID=414004 RepID=A0RXZ9_CENSY|nr:hypothetical protein CENSYa_1596 [Cenarchaeum symbiosum A]